MTGFSILSLSSVQLIIYWKVKPRVILWSSSHSLVMSERVNWEYLLEENVNPSLQSHIDELGQTEGGRAVHNWLKNTFEGELGLDWEGYCENGKYDALDEGWCVYEFKTKHENVFEDRPPYDRDVQQIEKYLSSSDVDADFGILVYLNRGDLTEVQQYLVNGSVTELG